MKTITIGIDLGTTNSAIATYKNGNVIIHKNPIGFSETLPSVVSFKGKKTLIGNKARERFLINSENTFSSFKRKMGTDELYFISILEKEISPIELSTLILKELQNFLIDEPHNQSAVITIPASFNTIQSNATKKAGYLANIQEVVLLQEPIAACVAYSNSQGLTLEKEEKWIVYDFGGGTFDVSLAQVSDRALKVLDHKGDIFLGGLDIDTLFVQKIICPALEKEFPQLENLWQKFIANKSASFKKFFHELLWKAEEAKKELSVKKTTILEVENDDLDIFLDIEITVDEFNTVVTSKFNSTYSLLEELIEDNKISFDDVSRIILVGGTTYIPYIRRELQQRTKIKIDTSIDPTTAVVLGAAYYAGSKESEHTLTSNENKIIQTINYNPTWVYEAQTNDDEELIVGDFSKKINGFYRITRLDGGFDSGITSFENRIAEFVPVVSKSKNTFKIQVFDKYKKCILEKDNITILHGVYSILGQPIPNDISIELDSNDAHSMLETIFKKNDVLPLSKTIYKTASKNILATTNDKLIIKVREGDVRNSAASNLLIGAIEISSKDISFDIIKGIDIELNFKISESRDLKIEVFIDAIDLKLTQVFSPSEIAVNIENVISEIKLYVDLIANEVALLDYNQSHLVNEIERIQNELIELYGKALDSKTDKLTEAKYQIDESKRKLIQQYDQVIRHKHILTEIENYNYLKATITKQLNTLNLHQEKEFNTIIKNEHDFLQSGNKHLLKAKIEKLNQLHKDIHKNSDDYYLDLFLFFKHDENIKNNLKKESNYFSLIESGNKTVKNQNFSELKHIISELYYNMNDTFIKNLSSKNLEEKQNLNKLGLK